MYSKQTFSNIHREHMVEIMFINTCI